ncbi:hypothetical protein [Afipia sp. DC4300-2b1]|uniref:hypothetical protein n=1 Tax=Afipia sp. DC4300-2b1 TaxID=2804672 RepID=UPI003CF7B9DD
MAMSRPKIVVSDSSVVMDLAKVRLVEPVLKLPFEFVIPDVILARDVADLGPYTAARLLRLGFVAGELDGAQTRCARDYFLQHRRQLSLSDCFAWRLAEVHKGILMTGDADLSTIAAAVNVEVRGILWAIEMMAKNKTSTGSVLAEALDRLGSDPLRNLPEAETRALREWLKAG